MKKLLGMLLVLVMVLSLAACGEGTTAVAENESVIYGAPAATTQIQDSTAEVTTQSTTAPADTTPVATQENHTHSYTEKVTKEASCSAEGVKTFTCECGDSYTESISKSAHKYTVKVTADATGKDEGTKAYTCSCGDAYNETFLLSTTFKGFVDQLTAKYGSDNGFMGEEGAGDGVRTICKYVGFSTDDGIHFSVNYREEYYDADDTPFQVNECTMKVELANNSFTVTAWY